MKFDSISNKIWSKLSRSGIPYVGTESLQLSSLTEAIKDQLIRDFSDWSREFIYHGTSFIVVKLATNHYVVGLSNTTIATSFMFERNIYGKNFWERFPKRLAEICDQIIIFSIMGL